MCPTINSGDKVVVNKLLMGGRIYKNLHFSKEGQQLQSWRLVGLRNVQRNDICVFNNILHKNQISFVINDCFCKRCIGLPGDSIWVENGFYHNNNFSNNLGLRSAQIGLNSLPDSIFSVRGINGNKYGWTIRNNGPIYLPRKGETISITPREAYIYNKILRWETGKNICIDQKRNIVTVDSVPLFRHTFKHDYYFMAGDNVTNSNDSRYWGLVPKEYIIGIVQWIIRGENHDIFFVNNNTSEL